MNRYQCKHCGRVWQLKSDKAWVKSFCEATGKNVRLMRMVRATKKATKR